MKSVAKTGRRVAMADRAAGSRTGRREGLDGPRSVYKLDGSLWWRTGSRIEDRQTEVAGQTKEFVGGRGW
jgi:hypothetical protein